MADGRKHGIRAEMLRKGRKTYPAVIVCKECGGGKRYCHTGACVSCTKKRKIESFIERQEAITARRRQVEENKKRRIEWRKQFLLEMKKAPPKRTPWKIAMQGVKYEDVEFL